MSTFDSGVSNWPCGHDCRYAAPLPGDDRLWCLRDTPIPARRTVSVGDECAWFCVKPLAADDSATPVER